MRKPIDIVTIILGLALIGIFQVNEAGAGCMINISGRNDSSEPVHLSRIDSKVKVKGGTWKRIFKISASTGLTFIISPNSTFNTIYRAHLGCNVKRRWKFMLSAHDGCEFPYSWYKPSSTTWFAKGTTDISVHELSRKCNQQ